MYGDTIGYYERVASTLLLPIILFLFSNKRVCVRACVCMCMRVYVAVSVCACMVLQASVHGSVNTVHNHILKWVYTSRGQRTQWY